MLCGRQSERIRKFVGIWRERVVAEMRMVTAWVGTGAQNTDELQGKPRSRGWRAWRDREKQKIQREPRRRGTGPVPRRKTLLFATQRCQRVAGSEEKYKLKFGNAQQKVSPEPVIWDRELTGHGSPR